MNSPGEPVGFDYSGFEGGSNLIGGPSSSSQETWKYTEDHQSATAATPTTKNWHQFVNNKGITNWDEHLREQGIDPQVRCLFITMAAVMTHLLETFKKLENPKSSILLTFKIFKFSQ